MKHEKERRLLEYQRYLIATESQSVLKSQNKRKEPGFVLNALSTQQYVDVHLFCAFPEGGVDQPIHIVSIFGK